MSTNSVLLVGKIISDPVFSQTPSGTSVCKFTLMTFDVYKGSVKEQKHLVSCMGKLCDIVAKYGYLGCIAQVDGRIEYWADKNKNRMIDIKATRIEITKDAA